MNNFVFHCPRLRAPLILTGDPRREPWESLPGQASLVLSDGSGQPGQSTQFWAAWDDQAFYVAFWCQDSDIRATMTHRDDKVWQEEAAEFFVSVDDDLTQYHEFQFSPKNIVRDIRVTNPSGRMEGSTFDGSWDCLELRSATHIEGKLNDSAEPDVGWGLEVAVPFDCLLPDQTRPEPGAEWRINFFRIYRSPVEEFCSWSPTYISPWEFHVPEYFGRLKFVEE